MNILFTRFPLESSYGGAEVQVLALMEGLIKRGHKVRFLGSCPALLKECKKRKIPSNQLTLGHPPVTKYGAINFLWRKRRMRKLLEAAMKQYPKPDAVIMLSLSEKLLLTPLLAKPGIRNPCLPARQACLAGRQAESGIRIIWLEHDRIGRWLKRNPWLSKLRRLSRQVTTIVVSELSKKIYLKLGFDPERVTTIPNGVDINPSPLTPLQVHPSPLTPLPKGEGNYIHVGCIARLTHDKGIDLLIEAAKDIPDIKLTIVGTGRDEARIKKSIVNCQLSKATQHRAHKRSGAGERVNCQLSIVITPRLPDLPSFYSSLDLLVLPSREHDPFGLVAAEAMALGVPVVVTDMCGIADYLESGIDSIIVRANSSETLKEGILKLVSDTALRKRIAKAGQKTAKLKFSPGGMIDKYEDLLTAKSSSRGR